MKKIIYGTHGVLEYETTLPYLGADVLVCDTQGNWVHAVYGKCPIIPNTLRWKNKITHEQICEEDIEYWQYLPNVPKKTPKSLPVWELKPCNVNDLQKGDFVFLMNGNIDCVLLCEITGTKTTKQGKCKTAYVINGKWGFTFSVEGFYQNHIVLHTATKAELKGKIDDYHTLFAILKHSVKNTETTT